MKKYSLFIAMMLTTTATICSAGTINKGVWSPTGCGAEPAAPRYNQATVDGYNKSVQIINDWQKKVADYNTCIVTEANNDNTTIAKSANDKQAKLKALTDKVHADTEAAKARLDKSGK